GGARTVLAKVLHHLQVVEGAHTVVLDDIPAEVFERQRSRAWVKAELDRLALDGELVKIAPGVWMFRDAADAAAAAERGVA
ncbi:hypothetical protein, partial [Amycolatopsis sp. NPDC058986]|uniref:hypothetical protein n=1 Tax=Amycolatopsis sp. NPDC058986 TaxID=3346685 RepID=UPI00366AAC19